MNSVEDEYVQKTTAVHRFMHCGNGVVPATFGSNGRRYIAAFARSGNYRKLPQPGNSFDLAHANFDGKRRYKT